ncbi:MAG TPA: hypothetical protein VK968_20300, partial [Roseimicrobium sp.]|nr:hypothetical protein [Roseimicrobium sp.]
DRRMDEMMAKPKNMSPAEIRLTTFSLKYNTAYWLSIEGLGRHWERAKANAAVKGPSAIELKTENVTHLSLNLPANQTLLAAGKPVSIQLDKSNITAPAPAPGQPWSVKLQKNGTAWAIAKGGSDRELRKSPGLQGPIDDAFSRSFLIVRPTGTSQSPEIGKWVKAELDDSIQQWWRQFRGHPRLKDDTAVTDADIAEHDLILWGDPKSNAVLAKILSKLPLTWDATTLKLGGATGVAASQVPVMIFPNPLNPKRYVVLNTGFTFSEFGSASNSQQTPKLPDWALIDTTIPRAQRIPKGVVTAGFFDERWQWEKPSGK